MADQSLEPLVCGKNCFRIKEKENSQKYDRHHCYVGSSEGANVSLGSSCTWGFTVKTKMDRNLPEEGSLVPKVSEPELEHSQPKCTSTVAIELTLKKLKILHELGLNLPQPRVTFVQGGVAIRFPRYGLPDYGFPHVDPTSPGYSPYKKGGNNPDPRKKY